VLLVGKLVGRLEEDRRVTKQGLRVCVANQMRGAEVALARGRGLGDQGCTVVQRLTHISNDGQGLIHNTDRLQGGPSGLGGIGSHGSHGVADIAHLVAGQDIGVANGIAEGAVLHEVAMRDRGPHTGDRQCRSHIELDDASMGQRAAQDPGEEHPGNGHVPHIAGTPRHLLDAIDVLDRRIANVGKVRVRLRRRHGLCSPAERCAAVASIASTIWT